jgi:hypothetical protein
MDDRDPAVMSREELTRALSEAAEETAEMELEGILERNVVEVKKILNRRGQSGSRKKIVTPLLIELMKTGDMEEHLFVSPRAYKPGENVSALVQKQKEDWLRRAQSFINKNLETAQKIERLLQSMSPEERESIDEPGPYGIDIIGDFIEKYDSTRYDEEI